MNLQETRPLLTVVIPVYNEADTVERLVERVRAVPVDKEIILVDDYSTDGTGAKLILLKRLEYWVLSNGLSKFTSI